MYAPHGQTQYLCHHVLSMACPGFLTLTEIKGDVGATRGPSWSVSGLGVLGPRGLLPKDSRVLPERGPNRRHREDEVSLLHLWQALENIFAVVRILFFLKVRRNDRAWRAQSKKPQSF
jgi:hypothetical protein